MHNNKHLVISDEVARALSDGRGVVALESTIISHGMPYPKNAQTALLIEELIRECGAIPATIAILGGKLKCGLSADEIEYLAHRGHDVEKASRRDLAALVAFGADGATTVATTMMIAGMAGIAVFATGGVGGVHRGAERTMDISADLEELGHTRVMVVCAGVKSILDIGLTLEYLETKGVPVIGYKSNEMAAFYTRSSGFGVDYTCGSPRELAALYKAHTELNLNGGILVSNPIPDEYSMPRDEIDGFIEKAVAEATEKGIRGKEITPFLLARIKELTGGESLSSNIELVKNNARLAAETACQIALMDS